MEGILPIVDHVQKSYNLSSANTVLTNRASRGLDVCNLKKKKNLRPTRFSKELSVFDKENMPLAAIRYFHYIKKCHKHAKVIKT